MAAVVVAVLCVGLYQIRPVRHWVKGVNQVPEPPWPTYRAFTLRQSLMDVRDAALARGDLETAALQEAAFSQEALRRTAAVQRAWMELRHPETKLFPESASDPEWNYRNTAADFYCFMLQAAIQLNPDDLSALGETLAAERALAGPAELCLPVNSKTAKPVSVDRDERIFSTSEYAKDGLLGVLERHGATPAGLPTGERLKEVTSAVINASQHQSRAGAILGTGSEEIGNMLQVCSRLSFAFADSDPAFASLCADYSARLAEAVLFEILPGNHGLPAHTFDFEASRVVDGRVHLRDHGNEVFPGLAEAYAAAVARRDDPVWAERAGRWAEPLALLYEKLLAHGRRADGLFMNVLRAESLQPIDSGPVDNWGYLLNGVMLFAQAARLHGYIDAARLKAMEDAVLEVSAAVSRQYGLEWEGRSADGYYDAIESALYVMNHHRATEPVLRRWVDDQVGLFFDRQQDDGFVRRHYLDGNFIRTSLMYADYKSGGFRVRPWREDVSVGFARSGDRGVVVVTARQPYTGVLIAGPMRHRAHMNLPWDWPRLNSFPEWSATQLGIEILRAEGLLAAGILGESPIPLDLPANGSAVLELRFRTSGMP